MGETHFMTLALRQAESALAEGKPPIGCVVVSNGNVFGRGRRRLGEIKRLDHAEMVAMREGIGIYGLPGDVVLYTTMEPCVMCFGMALNCGIDKIVYALEDPYGGATKMARADWPVRHRDRYPEIVSGVGRAEAKELLARFCRTTTDRFWRDESNPLVKLCLS